jgi:hypothetical protein
MDLTISPVNTKTLTVIDFVKSLTSVCDADDANNAARFMQKALFELFWKRSRAKLNHNPHLVTYRNTGHLAASVLLGTTPYSEMYNRLKELPILGYIKARDERQDDVRFMLMVLKNKMTLMLENCAIDNGLKTVYLYDRDFDVFIDSPCGTLIQHMAETGFAI